jgi:DNA-binding GntR family transcriptional regulator
VSDGNPLAARRASSLPASLAPISHLTLTDNVYHALKKQILNLELPLGSRIRDEDIAAQLGVSRTPVREAIRNLIRDGLIEVVPRSKTRVCTLSETDVNELVDLRMALESLAARLSATRIPKQALLKLSELYDLAEIGLKRGDTRHSLEFDRAMHQQILEHCGNPRLILMLNTINDYVTLFRNMGARNPSHKSFNYRHREIMRALARADGDAAAKAVEEHIVMSKAQTQRDFRETNTLQSPGKPAKAPRRGKKSA